MRSLQDKLLQNLPVDKRILKFKDKFSNLKKKYKASKFYDWHFFLTGSCKMGRDSFCSDNSIDLKKDKFTVAEFIKLTENSYGSEIIKQLK